MRIRGWIAFLVLTVSSLSFAAQKTRPVAVTVVVPGQSGVAASDVSVSVNGKGVTVAPAPLAQAPVFSDAKPDALSTELREPVANTVIFVFDAMDTKEIEDREMRKVALKYMADAATKKQSVGLLMMYRDGVVPIHDYRAGSAVLIAALAKANGATAADVPGAERTVALEAKRLQEFARGDYSTQAGDNVILLTNLESPIYMMQEVSAGLRDVPGRKAIIWVTAGVPFEIEERDHSLTTHLEMNNGAAVGGVSVQSTKRTATDDQIRKMQPAWRSMLANMWESGTAVYPIEARSNFSPPAGRVYTATMNTLAEMTGGRAFYGTNDPTPFLNSIAADNASAVRVSFGMDAPNDNWQKLSVTSSKGKVLAPIGIFPPADLSADDVRKKSVSTALNSRFGYAGVPFRLTLGEQTPNGGKTTVKLSVFLPPNAGVVDEKAGEVNLDIAAMAFGKKDERVGSMTAAAGGKLPADALKQIAEMGVNISKTIDLPSGEFRLRVVVRDNLTGRIGSIETWAEVK